MPFGIHSTITSTFGLCTVSFKYKMLENFDTYPVRAPQKKISTRNNYKTYCLMKVIITVNIQLNTEIQYNFQGYFIQV